MNLDIDDLKSKVDAFANDAPDRSSQSYSPIAAALASLCEHFDIPAAVSVIEQKASYRNSQCSHEDLQIMANEFNLSLEPIKGKIRKKHLVKLPVLIVDAERISIIWEIDGQGKKAKARVSQFGDAILDVEDAEWIPLADLTSKEATFLDCAPISIKDTSNDVISVRSFFKSPFFSFDALSATIAINILGLAIPLFTMNVYDRVLPNFSMDTLTVLTIGVCIAAFFDFVLRLLRSHIIDTTARRIDVLYLNRLFNRYLNNVLPKKKTAVGADVNAFRDTDVIREFHSSATLTAFGDLPFIAIFLAVIALIGGPLVWVTLIAVICMIVIGIIVQRPLARISEQAYQDTAHRNTVLVESIGGFETLKAMAAEGHAAAKWEKSVAAQIRSSVKSKAYTNFALSFMIFAQTIAMVALIFFSVNLIIQGTISPGAMMACMIIQGRTMAPVSQLSGLILRIYQVKAAERALAEIQTRPVERSSSKQFIKHPGIKGGFKFEDVSFSYNEEEGQPTLKNINLTVESGERIGIIGASGSGKSTFLKLISKIHAPDQGRILVDGLGLSAIDPTELRRSIGWAGADASLFAGTIRENLTLHSPKVNDQNILNAVRITGAIQWINQASFGFDTPLTEGGSNLSSGQRQTLLLARAFVTKPPIILLDEPTSSMDGRSEKQVIDQMRSEYYGQTMLIVTHRSSLFELVDRLIVIEKGEVIMDGPKAEILSRIQGQTAKKANNVNVSPASKGAA